MDAPNQYSTAFEMAKIKNHLQPHNNDNETETFSMNSLST